MAYNYSRFGRNLGPSAPTNHVPSFGQFSRPTAPLFPNMAPAPSSRQPEIVERTRSPPLAFGNSGPINRSYQAFSVRRPEAPQRVLSSPSAFENHSPAAAAYPSVGVLRPIEPPQRLDNGQRSFFKDYFAQTHPRPSVVTSFIPSSDFGTSAKAKDARFQELKRTRSPPLLYGDDEFTRNSSQTTIPRYCRIVLHYRSMGSF